MKKSKLLKNDEDEAKPFSVCEELNYFFRQGIPLGIQAIFAFGIPPLFAIFIAGQTSNSAQLQSAMGYGRTFYNIVGKMPITGALQYFGATIPAAIGANRKDRIASYFRRSMILVILVSIPGFILMACAEPIMLSLGIADDVAKGVGTYCSWMMITQFFWIIVMHFVTLFSSLKYNITLACVAFIGGVCIDMLCSYFFVYKLEWGIRGVAWAQMSVVISQFLVGLAVAKCLGLWDLFFVCNSESIFNWEEFRIFFRLSIPKILQNFGSWFVFELQIIFVTHIHGISSAAIAASAIWIQTETALASIQTGWVRVTNIRILDLLGQRKGREAAISFFTMSVAAFIIVGVYNLVFYIFMDDIATAMTNDHDAQKELKKIIWLLIPHSQSRITAIIHYALLPAINRGIFASITVYISFYFFGMGQGIAFGLEDWVISDKVYQNVSCLSMAIIGQIMMIVFGTAYFCFMSWQQVAIEVNERANSDKSGLGYEPVEESGSSQGTSDSLQGNSLQA